MSEYIPDKWVILRMQSEHDTIDKIYCGWYGGYLGSDEWKLSSGIVSTTTELDESKEGFINFKNESGSEYICYTNCEGTSGYMTSILGSWIKKLEDSKFAASITVIPYKDWKQII